MIANLQTRPVLVAAPLDEDRHPSPPEETAGPASAREYRIIYVARPMAGSPHEAIESDLNKAAQEGWRLVSALANEEGRTTGLILERERATTDGCASA